MYNGDNETLYKHNIVWGIFSFLPRIFSYFFKTKNIFNYTYMLIHNLKVIIDREEEGCVSPLNAQI